MQGMQGGPVMVREVTAKDVEKQVQLMESFTSKGKYKKTIESGLEFIKGWKNVETTWNTTLFWKYMGISYFHTRQYEKADRCFGNALYVLPEDSEAMVCRGMVSFTTGKLDRAINFLEESLKTNPDDAKALTLLSLSLGLKGDKEKSKEYLQKATAKDKHTVVDFYISMIDAYYKNPGCTNSQRIEIMKLKSDLKKMLSEEKK